MLELDLEMQSRQRIYQLLASAQANSQSRCTDRSQTFAPRMHLAEIQYLFESRRTAEAGASFQSFLSRNATIPNRLLKDFIELVSHGFSLSELYERDHAS